MNLSPPAPLRSEEVPATDRGCPQIPLGGAENNFCLFECIFAVFLLYFNYRNGFWSVFSGTRSLFWGYLHRVWSLSTCFVLGSKIAKL